MLRIYTASLDTHSYKIRMDNNAARCWKMPSDADKRIILQEITGLSHYIPKKAKNHRSQCNMVDNCI